MIPESWKTVSLSSISTVNGKYGANASACEFDKDKPRYIRITDIDDNGLLIPEGKVGAKIDNLNEFIVEKNDLLFVRTGSTTGKCYLHQESKGCYIFAGFLVKFQINKNKAIPYYIWTLTKGNSYKKWIQIMSVRSGQPGINGKEFGEYKINLPPLPEQKKIAEILSTWDEAIETNETLISLYEKYLNSLALSLVKKKILINENVWKQTILKDVFYDRKSYGCQSDNLKLHSLTIEDGVTAKTDRYNREFLVKGDSKKYKIAKLHDLVFNPQNLRYGAIAVNSIEHDVLLSPIYATLEIKDPTKYDIDYLGYLLTSKEMISFYDSIAEGTLVERMAVKPDVFLNQVFSIPDIATQKKIANILNTFKKKIYLFKKNKAELQKQKQGLMQRLLTGKVRVKLD
ncbi:MAG: restriction endonuclease subunit S [Bacilli bacterium]